MLKLSLPWPDTSILFSAPLDGLPPVLRWGIIAALIVVPMVLLLLLYSYELRLVTGRTATALLGLRLIVFSLVLALLCAQPIYARDVRHSLPGRVIVIVDRSASMDVADPQRDSADKLRLARLFGMANDIDAITLERWISDHHKNRTPHWLSDEEMKAKDGNKELAGKRMARHDEICKQVDELTRTVVANRILEQGGLDLLRQIGSRHEVELYTIDREVRELKRLDGEEKNAETAAYTDLRAPLARVIERSGAGTGKVLGVIVLTEGQHNIGRPPAETAEELGKRGIPIYPVALGERTSPPDVALVAVRGPNHTVFKDVEAAVEVQFKIAGMQAQEFVVEIHRDGKERKLLATKSIKHDGQDRYYSESFPIRMEDVGTQTVSATVKPAQPGVGPKETLENNNTLSTTIAVADDRAKVLLVDGEARWELHYLATALQRDRLVELKTIVFDQPRLNTKVSETELEKLGTPGRKWPEGEGALASYSSIILGDVDLERLSLAERQRLEKYVADAGGTLIIAAGKRFMPMAFPERGTDGESDPLRRLLPIESPGVVAPEEGFKLVLTGAGRDQLFTKLDDNAEDNDTLWAGFPRPWGWGVSGRAKPGATALARIPGPDEEKLPASERDRRSVVVARHNYGFGRVLFVGIDSTWRWRYKVGDMYHHKFWGQVIKWAAADRPLTVGNDHVRFGTPMPVYRQGDPVEVRARIDERVGTLRPEMQVGAKVIRVAEKGEEAAKDADRATVALIPLARGEAQPRNFTGSQDLPPGKYAIELAIPDLADKLNDKDGKPLRTTFTVLPSESRETAELGRNDALLADLARRSGGQVYTPFDVAELVEKLQQEGIEYVEHHEQRAWQWWPILAIIVVLLTLEWMGRKLAGLP